MKYALCYPCPILPDNREYVPHHHHCYFVVASRTRDIVVVGCTTDKASLRAADVVVSCVVDATIDCADVSCIVSIDEESFPMVIQAFKFHSLLAKSQKGSQRL